MKTRVLWVGLALCACGPGANPPPIDCHPPSTTAASQVPEVTKLQQPPDSIAIARADGASAVALSGPGQNVWVATSLQDDGTTWALLGAGEDARLGTATMNNDLFVARVSPQGIVQTT